MVTVVVTWLVAVMPNDASDSLKGVAVGSSNSAEMYLSYLSAEKLD